MTKKVQDLNHLDSLLIDTHLEDEFVLKFCLLVEDRQANRNLKVK